MTDQSAQALVEGGFHSARAIDAIVPGLVPKAASTGVYDDGQSQVHFYIADFHDMDLSVAPNPTRFIGQIAKLHADGLSTNGMFGYPVPTVIGIKQRTATWEKSWARSFTHQLEDILRYDKETNGPWPELAAASKQPIEEVIP